MWGAGTKSHTETDLLLQHCALAAMLDSSERMNPACCHPHTRNAVIEEIMAWIEDSNPAASMMIMHGPAGSEKSALAQSIAERCKLRWEFLIAPFFSWIFIVLCWITWAFGWIHPPLIVIDGLNECADIEV